MRGPRLRCWSVLALAMMTERSPAMTEAAHDHAGRARLLRNILVLSSGQVVTWILAVIWTLFVPRALGPAGMGLLVLNWSAAGLIAVLAGLGTRNLLVREIAADHSRTPVLLGSALYLRALLVLPALAVTLLYVHVGRFDQERTVFLLLAYAGAVTTLFTEPLQAAFQGIERMEFLAIGDMVLKTVGTVTAIVLVLLGYRALGLVVLSLVLGCMVLTLFIGLIRRYVQIDLRFDAAAITRLFRDSLAFWAFGVFFTIYLWIDSMLLAVLAPPAVLGWYGVPTKLFGTLMFASTILCTAWLPRLARAHRRSPAELWASARSLLELMMVLCLPISVGAASIAAPLITILYGHSFAPSIPVFAILAFTVVPMYLNIVVNQVLIASNRQILWSLVMAGASIVNPVLNLALIPYFQRTQGNGAIGAAVALLLTEILIVGIGLAVVWRAFSWSVVVRLFKAIAATIGMALVVGLVARYGLLAQVVVGVATFGALALALRLVSVGEVDDIRGLLGRRGVAVSVGG